MTTRTRKLIDRERLWALAVELAKLEGGFTGYQLSDLMKRSPEYVRLAIKDWKQFGFVVEDGVRGNRIFYRVTDKAGLPPISQPDGRLIRCGTAHGNIWRAMRILPSFDAGDLVMHANTPSVPVTREEAQEYCRFLAAAGYLRVIRKATPTLTPRYKLIKNSGPLPPRERRVRAVYDDNLEQFTHVAGGLDL